LPLAVLGLLFHSIILKSRFPTQHPTVNLWYTAECLSTGKYTVNIAISINMYLASCQDAELNYFAYKFWNDVACLSMTYDLTIRYNSNFQISWSYSLMYLYFNNSFLLFVKSCCLKN
jgi:hypothetical protein